MSPRRNKNENELLDSRLTQPPRAPRESAQPGPPGRSPLQWLSDANNAMWAGEEPRPPSRMQPPEDQAGYLLVLGMIVLGIVLTIVHGKGSPKHPLHWVQIIGLVVAGLTPVAIFRYANRFVTAMMVVVAAFCISLVAPPSNLFYLYYAVLLGPLGYAFWLTRRQSKAARAQAARNGRGPSNRAASGRGAPGRGGKSGDSAPKRGGRKGDVDVIVPVANRRYTPPKAPRERPKRSELAAAPPEPTSRRLQRRQQAAADKAAKDR